MQTQPRIRQTKEQIRHTHLRALLGEVLDSLSQYDDENYYDYVIRLDNIIKPQAKIKASRHKGEDRGESLKRVYKLVGDIAN
jgi:hypothetical protein